MQQVEDIDEDKVSASFSQRDSDHHLAEDGPSATPDEAYQVRRIAINDN
jgi:hypothetical protein